MDEVYAGRLSAHPHAPTEPEVHIPQPQPHQPIPVQLPNIYVSPFPAAPPPPPPATWTKWEPLPPQAPINIPTPKAAGSRSTMKVGPFTIAKPHPLLWISLVLSLIALVLGVPKGSLPTLTGRHKELRAREKIVDEKLHLLSHLSHFLPTPLAHLVHPDPTRIKYSDIWTVDDHAHAGLKFWSSGHGGSSRMMLDRGDEGRWWSVEELGEGASVVRSSRAGTGAEKEVWVLRMGETEDSNRPLLSALTHSLLLRDRLQQDLDEARSRFIIPHAPAQAIAAAPSALPVSGGTPQLALGNGRADEREEQQELLKEEWERLEMRKRRDKEREREVEDRERAVGNREKWVVEEMKKMSEKVHSQTSELTLEDRITERLKSYQRQLAHIKAESGQAEGASWVHGEGAT